MMYLNLQDAIDFLNRGMPPPQDAGLFGASLARGAANISILGVPWDVTTSFAPGTNQAPEAIRLASHQLDLRDHFFGNTFEAGIHYHLESSLEAINSSMRKKAEAIIGAIEQGDSPDVDLLNEVNTWSAKLNAMVQDWGEESIAAGLKVGLIGGDHSVPLGLMKAVAKYTDFGILHIDAHHDLRNAYEGFTYSHASIFYNALEEIPQITSLLSIGIRDYAASERQYAETQPKRIRTYYQEDLAKAKFEGVHWDEIAARFVTQLPEKVYISIDIDGLDQVYCPHTGTPVPGGLSFEEVVHILHRLGRSKKTIVGFDLVEVGSQEWDANVGARLLYKLCGLLNQSSSLNPKTRSN